MRVQLTRLRAHRDDGGAIALLAAFLATGLLVISAFTVDFGMAYVSKQRLQEAADAGALAAVQVYKGHTGTCATLAADASLEQQAQQAADRWAEQNRPGKVGGTIAVTCSSGGLTVTYGTTGDTEVGLGQLAGVGSRITTSRVAAATIGKSTQAVGGLRPWGICSGVATTSGQVVFVPMKWGSTTSQDSASLCGPDNPPGDWYVMKCAGQSNAIGATEAAVANGCGSTNYAPVPNQPSTGAPQLYAFLKAACPRNTSNTVNCLKADPGNNFHLTSEEWQPLVGQTFTMPVMCATPACSHLEYDAQGNNIVYGIHRMATVELCGFKMQPLGPSTGWPTTGPCATSNPRHYAASNVTSGAGLFLVIKGMTGGPGGDWSLDEYTALRLTR